MESLDERSPQICWFGSRYHQALSSSRHSARSLLVSPWLLSAASADVVAGVDGEGTCEVGS